MKARLCKWHKCACSFVPTDNRQEYCSIDCRKRRAEWAKMRGSRLVNLILDSEGFTLKHLRDERDKLREEINQALRNRA